MKQKKSDQWAIAGMIIVPITAGPLGVLTIVTDICYFGAGALVWLIILSAILYKKISFYKREERK